MIAADYTIALARATRLVHPVSQNMIYPHRKKEKWIVRSRNDLRRECDR